MAGKQHIPERRKAKQKSQGTIKSKRHLAHREGKVGNEERLASYIKRTMELKRDGYHYHEIGTLIAKEYNLEVVPHFTTVAKWRRVGMDAIDEDIIALASQMRMDQWEELERMKSKWLPIATAQEIEIQRWQRVEGELQPIFDENALSEQIEATKQVVSICAAQAKLFGLNMEQAVSKEGGGVDSIQSLQLWMIGQIGVEAIPEKMAKGMEVPSEVLELKSGIPEVDSV